jgi:hypothetical protein
MPLLGDFGRLDLWARKLGALASASVAFEVSEQMANRTLGFIAQEFEQERDPFNRRWSPKKRPDGRKILRGETNRLIQWRKTYVNQHGFKLSTPAPYFRYHQTGTRRMVARKILPTGTRLPAVWSSEFRGIYLRAMHRRLK